MNKLENFKINAKKSWEDYFSSNKIILENKIEIEKIIEDFIKNNNIYGNFIDIGCGVGNYTEKFSSYFGNSFGIDLSETAIKIASEKKSQVKYIQKDCTNLSDFQCDYFDFAISICSIHC